MFYCSGSSWWWYATLRDSDTFATTMSPQWHLKKSAWYREMCPFIPLLNSLLIGGEIRSRVWGKSHIFSFLEKIKKIPLYSVHVALLVSWPISSATKGKLLPKKLLTSFFMQWGNFNSIWMRTVFHLKKSFAKISPLWRDIQKSGRGALKIYVSHSYQLEI